MRFTRYAAFLFLAILISFPSRSQIVLQTPGINSILYLGETKNQPLIVGLGGSEGGNAWASDHWKTIRNEFLKKGYAFLALGYFGAKGTPDTLDRISINKVHDAILQAAAHQKVDRNRIAIVGGSRGGDLALLVATYYPNIHCVVAIVPSNVVFPAHTSDFSTAAWAYNNKELDFVPVNEQAVPFLMKHDLRRSFEAMLQDTAAERKALIRVEKINGSVLLLSAESDEFCPSTPMCDKMISRLKQYNFPQHSEHVAYPGGHAEPLKHFSKVFEFLERYF